MNEFVSGDVAQWQESAAGRADDLIGTLAEAARRHRFSRTRPL